MSSQQMPAPPVPLKPLPISLHQKTEFKKKIEEHQQTSIPIPLPRRYYSMHKTERPTIEKRTIYKVSFI